MAKLGCWGVRFGQAAPVPHSEAGVLRIEFRLGFQVYKNNSPPNVGFEGLGGGREGAPKGKQEVVPKAGIPHVARYSWVCLIYLSCLVCLPYLLFNTSGGSILSVHLIN